VHSKLPDVETTIFTIMSRRAAQTGALNIGQGFPDYPIDPELAACATQAMQEGRNQYAPMEGVLDLREAIAAKLRQTQSIVVDPVTEVTLSCGGTEALFSAIQAFVSSGDNVIVFDPAYDSYEPAVRLAGGECRRLALRPPNFRIDWQQVADAIDARTRLIILNNPHNPACTIATSEDLDCLAAVLRERDCRVLSDEVYEHVVFDGHKHRSVLAHPELRERSLAVFSFGKTLHVTGWRVGSTKSISSTPSAFHRLCNMPSMPTYVRSPAVGRNWAISFSANAICYVRLCRAQHLFCLSQPGPIFSYWIFPPCRATTMSTSPNV
jgi:methionine transaminase